MPVKPYSEFVAEDLPAHAQLLLHQTRNELTAAQKRLVRYYTNSGFEDYNDLLRLYPSIGDMIADMPKMDSGYNRMAAGGAQVLKKAIALHQLSHPLLVFRSTKLVDVLKGSGNKMPNVGDVYTAPSFLSTTTNFRVAISFGPMENVHLEIEIPAGMHVMPIGIYSHYKEEDEVLIAPGAKFKVTSYDSNKRFEGSGSSGFYKQTWHMTMISDGIK